MVSATEGIRQTGSVSDRLYGQPCRDTRHLEVLPYVSPGASHTASTAGTETESTVGESSSISKMSMSIIAQLLKKTEKVGSGYHLKGM